MRFETAARRLAVTVPFFTVAGVLLGFFSRPETPAEPRVETPARGVLIVTTADLDPAFRALETWNEERGCPAEVYTVPRLNLRSGPGLAATLGVLSRERGVNAILLGGDRRQLPVTVADSRDPLSRTSAGLRIEPVPTPDAVAMPAHLWMGRAPVTTLPEAWAFVEACRSNGKTLDELIRSGGTFASVPPSVHRPAPTLPAVALPAASD